MGGSFTTAEGAAEGVPPVVGPVGAPTLIGPGPDYAHLEQLLLETQGEIHQVESRIMPRLDSIQSSFELCIAQQIERDATARAEEAIHYQSTMDTFERMRGTGSSGPH